MIKKTEGYLVNQWILRSCTIFVLIRPTSSFGLRAKAYRQMTSNDNNIVPGIVHVRHHNMNLPAYVGRTMFSKEKFMSLMPPTIDTKD